MQEISRAKILYKINNISRSVENIVITVDKVDESQNRIKDILGDLYDIIKGMKRMDEGEPQDTELLQKIKDISHRMNQFSLGQESVKETMIELRDSIEGNPHPRKRTYYQTVSSEKKQQDRKGKQPRLSSEINPAYLDKQYGDILEVPKARQLRKGIREHFLELHEAAKKWKLLNYHLQVICHEDPELDPLPALRLRGLFEKGRILPYGVLDPEDVQAYGPAAETSHRLQSLPVIPEYHFPRVG